MGKSLLVILIFVLPFYCSVAQTGKIKQLEKRITELEKRVEKLEGLLPKRKNSKLFLQKASGKLRKETGDLFKNVKNWRKLEIGMKDSVVKKILGSPTRISAGKYTKIWWYKWRDNRTYKIGHAAFDNRHKLILWVEP